MDSSAQDNNQNNGDQPVFLNTVVNNTDQPSTPLTSDIPSISNTPPSSYPKSGMGARRMATALFGILVLAVFGVGGTLLGNQLINSPKDINKSSAALSRCSEIAVDLSTCFIPGGLSGTAVNCILDSEAEASCCPSGHQLLEGACIAPPPPPANPACIDNSQCNSGQVCYEGQCKDQTRTGECPIGGFWIKYYCENQFGMSGGCQQGGSPPLTSRPAFDASFCGTQQIDCAGSGGTYTGLFDSKEDRSACNAPPGATNPPAPSCGSQCTKDSDCTALGGNTACTNIGSNGIGYCWSAATCENNPPPAMCTTSEQCPVGNGNGPEFCGPKENCVVIDGRGEYPFDSSQWEYGCVSDPECNPTIPPVAPQCVMIKAYNENFVELNATQLTQLKAGDKVRFAITGSATSGSFDKARFYINSSTTPVESTTKRPNTEEFYYEYTIPTGVTTFNVQGEVHHLELNQWK